MVLFSSVRIWSVPFTIHFVILLSLTKDGVGALHPSSAFSRYRVVTPTLHHIRTKRELASSKHDDGLHHKELTLKLPMDDEDYILDLRLNEDVVSGDHVVYYQKNGEMVQHKPSFKELDICQYTGKVRGKRGSWAALSTCHGVRGTVSDGDNTIHVEPTGPSINSPHYVYYSKDLETPMKCGYRGANATDEPSHGYDLINSYSRKIMTDKSRISRYKRSADDIQVRGPFGENESTRYIELAMVVDHSEFLASGSSVSTVHHQMKDLVNIINSLYMPINIFVALVGVEVWTERDEFPVSEDSQELLSDFVKYRMASVIPRVRNDNAQFLTKKRLKEGIVGKAHKSTMCTYAYSGGIASNHTPTLTTLAATIAHEMGHNLGMEHDTSEDCKCAEPACIMSPSSNNAKYWSNCSLKYLVYSFEKGFDYCLRNKPKRLFEPPTCGNGFVEPGEQCDCGLSPAPGCTACCDGGCQLRANATCATGRCCDTLTCRPKPAGTVCRSSARECDLPEYCSGHSEYCPLDVYAMDTTPCGGGEAYCATGWCKTHTDQCKLLWGPSGEMSHLRCFEEYNIRGDDKGHCGYDVVSSRYARCARADPLCGLLQCRHLNEKLEFGMEAHSKMQHSFINDNGKIAPCRSVTVDLGIDQVDPGLVPDGARCGVNKMCQGQKCKHIEDIQHLIKQKESSVCPSDCSGHGVCNSEGHCHCDVGFAPPLCAVPGAGGSLDSGPASDLTVQRNFMIAMYIIFLGIIPALLLLMFLIYYSRHNVLRWKKPKKSMQSPKKTSLQHRLSRSASKFASNFQNSSHSQTNNVPPVNVHTLSSPDDMSSSLLRSDSDRSPTGNINPSVNFFGNFRGFSLTPMDKESEPDSTKDDKQNKIDVPNANKSAKITPVNRSGSNSQMILNQGVLKPVLRSAPPLPVVPVAAKTNSPKSSPSVKRTNSSVQNRLKAFIGSDKVEELHPVTANPPARPVISSPILEASTCTAKELISPLQGSKTLGPVRTAPTVPTISPDLPKRPLSMHSAGNVLQKPLPEEPKKVKEGISLNRIASFLKSDKPKEKERNPVERSHSLPKNPNNQIRIPKNIDKVALRNLQISNPILQKEIDLPVNTVPVVSDSEDGDDGKSFVNRTQSMRGPPVTNKPLIQSFGSMRQAPGAPRPVSVVGRPTAPPPPLPSHEQTSHYQNPKPHTDIKSADYVDCIEEKQAPLAHIDEESSDNIYAIIEESPEKRKPFPSMPIKTTPQEPPVGYNTPKPITSNSGSTESMGLLGEIVNEIQNRNFDSIYSEATLSRRKKDKEKKEDRDSTYMNSEYRTPESVYSNSGAKSNVSTTSSGYLHPSAVNVPTFVSSDKEKASENVDKTPPSPTMKINSKIPTFSRQVTPPGLKNTSTFKNVPQSPKNVPKNVNNATVNSPDIISSCETKNSKPPDVINNNKTVNDNKVTNKTNLTTKPNDNTRPPLKPFIDKKTVKTTPSLKPVSSSTNLKGAEKPVLNRVSSKVDSNVKAIADNLNKNKPKLVPKPSNISVQRTDSNVKPSATKLSAKPSNVASLQQKFENRKSIPRDTTVNK